MINYLYTLDNTFDSAVARECRGLKFDPDGKLIARPFHKFFNLAKSARCRKNRGMRLMRFWISWTAR